MERQTELVRRRSSVYRRSARSVEDLLVSRLEMEVGVQGRPAADIAAANAAQHRLVSTLDRLTEAAAHHESLLPGWTVGHILTHLARHAEGNIRIFAAAARGNVAEQYPGGRERRNADIEAGASRPVDVLVNDVIESCKRLSAAWDATSEVAWQEGIGETLIGSLPLSVFPSVRRREVEVHHVDLGLDYRITDWPDDFVDEELVPLITDLPSRLPDGMVLQIIDTDTETTWVLPPGNPNVTVSGDRRSLLAWMLGRYKEPEWPTLAFWM